MQPLKPDNWPEELNDIRSFLGNPLNIHSMMAHHPKLLKVWMPLRNHVVSNSSSRCLPDKLLLLTTWLRKGIHTFSSFG